MPQDLPVQDPVASSLEAYEPERYWTIWQFPEGRYAYSVGLCREAWMILLDSEAAAGRCLMDDARDNGRRPSQYRVDELSLSRAFDAVRAQAVPFPTSYGTIVRRVLGVELRTADPVGGGVVRHIPV